MALFSDQFDPIPTNVLRGGRNIRCGKFFSVGSVAYLQCEEAIGEPCAVRDPETGELLPCG